MSKKNLVVDDSKVQVDLDGEQGVCPYCGSEDINFQGPDVQDGMIYYDGDCGYCNNSFKEWYNVEFSAVYGYPLKK